MNLLLVDADEISEEGTLVLVDERARHLRQVLGVEPGRTVRIGVIEGAKGQGTVREVSPERVVLECEITGEIAERPPIDVLLALPRPKVLKRLWAPLASLGVGRVMLTNAERVERDYFDAHAVQPSTYVSLLREGLSQAKDTRMPIVTVSKSLRRLVEDELDGFVDDARRVLADPAYDRSVLDTVRTTAPGRRVLLALGPEGGWNPFERDLFARHGFVGAGLGPRTLRSDIAVIAILSIAHEGWRGAQRAADAGRFSR